MIKYLWSYLWKNRLWWLIPPIVIFIIVGILIAVSAAAPVSPFIYVLF